MTWMRRTKGYYPTSAEVEIEIVLGTDAESIAREIRGALYETRPGGQPSA